MSDSTVLESSDVEAVTLLAALADPVRLAIVRALAESQRCVCELQERVGVAPNLLSYHLRVLREAGLIAATRRGRWIDYQLDTFGCARLWTALASAVLPSAGQATETATTQTSTAD